MIRHFQPAQLRHIQALHTVSVPLLLIIRQKSLQLAKIVLCILCKIMRMPVRMVHLSTLRRKCLWGTVGIAAIVMRIRMCTDLLPGRCSNFMYQLRRIQDLSRAFFCTVWLSNAELVKHPRRLRSGRLRQVAQKLRVIMSHHTAGRRPRCMDAIPKNISKSSEMTSVPGFFCAHLLMYSLPFPRNRSRRASVPHSEYRTVL